MICLSELKDWFSGRLVICVSHLRTGWIVICCLVICVSLLQTSWLVICVSHLKDSCDCPVGLQVTLMVKVTGISLSLRLQGDRKGSPWSWRKNHTFFLGAVSLLCINLLVKCIIYVCHHNPAHDFHQMLFMYLFIYLVTCFFFSRNINSKIIFAHYFKWNLLSGH